MTDEQRSEAARQMGRAKSDRKKQASAASLTTAREKLASDPEAAARKREAVSAAQRARWDRYRAEKEAEKKSSESLPIPLD